MVKIIVFLILQKMTIHEFQVILKIYLEKIIVQTPSHGFLRPHFKEIYNIK